MYSNKRLVVFVALGVSGFAALVYEVVWFRALSLILGSTVYATSTMLSSFIAGLALGGWLGGHLSDRTRDPYFAFGLVQLCIGIACLVTLPVLQNLSPVYAGIFYTLHLHFFLFSVVQFALAFIVMLPSTTLMGMSFPLALKVRGNTLARVGRDGGGLFAINSFGAAGGAVMAGLILLPMIGLKGSNLFAAFINLSIAAVVLVGLKKKKAIVLGTTGFIVAAFLPIQLETPHYYFNYYIAERVPSYEEFTKRRDSIKGYYREDGSQGTVEVLGIEGTNVKWLVNGGHPEGSVNTQDSGRYTQILLSALPLGIKTDATKYLEIGLGPGNTLKTASLYPGLEEIDCIEINPAVIKVNRMYFYPELFEDKRIRFIKADARHYLTLSKKRYDVIVAQPSEATESHSANLFTKEFYSLVKKRLLPGGIFTQYISYYFLTEEEGLMMLKTWTKVFNEVYAWYLVEKGIILVGSNDKLGIDGDGIKKRVNEKLDELKYELGFNEIDVDFFWLGAGPEKIKKSLG
jgi:spermidine synthase